MSSQICNCGLYKQKPSVDPTTGIEICLKCNLPTTIVNDADARKKIEMSQSTQNNESKIQIKDSTEALVVINSIIAVLSTIGFCFIIFTAQTCIEFYSDGSCYQSVPHRDSQSIAFAGILYTILIANLVVVFVEHVRRSMFYASNK
jgi:hypothetical protein